MVVITPETRHLPASRRASNSEASELTLNEPSLSAAIILRMDRRARMSSAWASLNGSKRPSSRTANLRSLSSMVATAGMSPYGDMPPHRAR